MQPDSTPSSPKPPGGDRAAARLLAAIPDVVFELDSLGRWTAANGSLRTLLGYAFNEIQGGLLSQLAPTEEADDVAHRVDECTRLGRASTFLARLRSREGDSRECRVSLAPLRSREGKVVGAAGTLVDLTRFLTDQARHAESARRDATTTLADGVAMLGVELAFGVEAEGALDVGDLLERRTRLWPVPAAASAAAGQAQLVARSCL